MLINASDVYGFSIHATDGDIGHVNQLYFDDESWIVRYLVVDTGNWLTGRTVLISNYSIGEIDRENRKIHVELTREQVEGAPANTEHQPLSRQWESKLFDYYGFPYYWNGLGYGVDAFPLPGATSDGAVASLTASATPGTSEEDTHLQSTKDVVGYYLEALDGEIGHVKDFVIQHESWTIRYVEVDTRNWWPGKKVLVAPAWIKAMQWPEQKVLVNLNREIIKQAPEYDHNKPITPKYETELFDYYGMHLDESLKKRPGE